MAVSRLVHISPSTCERDRIVTCQNTVRLTTRWSRPGPPGVEFGAILALAGRAAHLEAVRPLKGMGDCAVTAILAIDFMYQIIVIADSRVSWDPPTYRPQ